jgi:hypothetical protein
VGGWWEGLETEKGIVEICQILLLFLFLYLLLLNLKRVFLMFLLLPSTSSWRILFPSSFTATSSAILAASMFERIPRCSQNVCLARLRVRL